MDKSFFFSRTVQIFTLKIFVVGTIRSDRRNLPTQLEDKNFKRDDFDYRIAHQDIAFFKWKDNREVHMLTNYHGNNISSVERTWKNGAKIQVSAPSIIKHYNDHMRRIDKANMLRSFYDGNKKSKRCSHRLFFALTKMFLVDSCIVFIEARKNISFLNYERNVTQDLATLSKEKPKRRGGPNSEITARIKCHIRAIAIEIFKMCVGGGGVLGM